MALSWNSTAMSYSSRHPSSRNPRIDSAYEKSFDDTEIETDRETLKRQEMPDLFLLHSSSSPFYL